MPLDYTIPLKAQAPQTNPLQTMLQAAQYRYMNQHSNQLQQQMGANQAVSEAIQRNTGPDGKVDLNAVQSDLSKDPRAAYDLQASTGTNMQQQGQQTLNSTNAQALATKQGMALAQAGLAWMQNPNATGQDLLRTLSGMHQDGVIGDDMYANAMNRIAPLAGNATALRNEMTMGLSRLSPELQAQLQLPKTGSIDNGSSINTTATDPLTGAVAVTGTLKKTLTPGERITQIPTYQNGQPGTKSAAQLSQEQGNGDLLPPGTSNAQGGNGRYPGTQPTQANGGGFNPTNSPLGASGIAEGAAKRYDALQTAAGTAKNQMKNYDLALEAVGSALPGKGGAKALNVPSLLNTFGLQAGSDTLKNNQLLLSYLNSAADQAASALGLSGSDSRLAAAKAGQPDPQNMNAPALLESIQHVKGLQQAVLDRSTAATAYLGKNGNNTGSLPQFESAWNKAFDPDISLLRSLPENQRAEWIDKHIGKPGSASRNRFLKSYDEMRKLGAF